MEWSVWALLLPEDKMKHFICIDCDHVWMDLDHEGCPECKSMDVIDDTAPETSDWEDGHFEGQFPSLPHGFDSGLE